MLNKFLNTVGWSCTCLFIGALTVSVFQEDVPLWVWALLSVSIVWLLTLVVKFYWEAFHD